MDLIINILFYIFSAFMCINGSIILHEDSAKLNISCFPIVTCRQAMTNPDSMGVSLSQPCSCNSLCSVFNTCCMDSFHNQSLLSEKNPTCREVKSSFHNKNYYVIDRCLSADSGDSVFENLCNDEWEGESDLMKLVPVTSLLTSMTYKNYFCFRCHETTSDYVYWNVRLQSKHMENGTKFGDLTYETQNKSWVVRLEEDGTWVDVDLTFDVPQNISHLLVECIPNLISNCSDDWTDDFIRQKCHSYMSILSIGRYRKVLYRNPHCAMCNFNSCKNRNETVGHVKPGYGGGYGGGPRRPGYGGHGRPGGSYGLRTTMRPSSMSGTRGGDKISFILLMDINKDGEKVAFSMPQFLDINPTDGEKVGKVVKCGENFQWDPFVSRCRKLGCALPGYIVKGEKCVRQ